MQDTKNIDFKKKYYSLLRELGKLNTMLKHPQRCPWANVCCHGCKLLEERINQAKKNLLDNNEEWGSLKH